MEHNAAAIYARISQDRIGAGLGIERQEQDCRELAERLGWNVVDVYADNDISASTGRRRPEYERLLQDIEAGHITAVISWHVDRIHRSPVELERYISTCEPRGVPTHTVRAGELDLTTATGRMTARVIGAVARHESEQKGERLKRQRAQAQAQGRWIGGRRPFGFEADGVTHRSPEAALIKQATDRILAGESVRSIVAEWNEQGVTTATGTTWEPTKVRAVLMRPRNAGLVGSTNGDRIVGPAMWEPIVDRETWEALRALLNDPSRLMHSGTSRKLVGSFLYRCECGALIKSAGTGASGKARYSCSRSSHMYKTAEPCDAIVFGLVERILLEEGIDLVAPAEDLSPLRERLRLLHLRSEEIASAFGDPDSGMTGQQFKLANERVQREIQAVEAEIGRRSAGSALAGVADAADPIAAFRDLSIDRQRAVIDALMVVTLRPSGQGRKVGGRYFDPQTVDIKRKR